MLPLMTVILIVLGISGMRGVEGNPVQGGEFEKILERIVRISASTGATKVRQKLHTIITIVIFLA